MFLTNQVSAKRVQELANHAEAGGVAAVSGLRKAGASGKHPANICRDLLRQLVKGCKVPEPYYIRCPLFDKKKNTVIYQDVPVLLPHEVLHEMVMQSEDNLQKMLPTEGSAAWDKVDTFVQKHQLTKRCFPLGVWADGVPFASKQRDSLEVFTWMFTSEVESPRFLYVALPKSSLHGKATYDVLWDLLVWSLRFLLLGTFPTSRHDGTPWTSKDGKRAKAAGGELCCHGVLHQVRGDWQFFVNSFSFNSWTSTDLCVRCGASNGPPHDFRQCGLEASWRRTRKTGMHWIVDRQRQGSHVSPLFGAPDFDPHDVVPDWLHCVDLGVQADLLGNLFYEVVEQHMPGANRDQRLRAFLDRLLRWNKETKPQTVFDNMTWEMIQAKASSPPKLRGKGAEVRHVLPFAILLAEDYQDGSIHRHTVLWVLKWMARCGSLVKERPYQAAAAAEAARNVALLWAALEGEARSKGDFISWRLKPKLHLFQELMEFVAPVHGPPNTYHCYLDERIGGWMALMATRRGGAKVAASCALNCLNRYRAYAKDGM